VIEDGLLAAPCSPAPAGATRIRTVLMIDAAPVGIDLALGNRHRRSAATRPRERLLHHLHEAMREQIAQPVFLLGALTRARVAASARGNCSIVSISSRTPAPWSLPSSESADANRPAGHVCSESIAAYRMHRDGRPSREPPCMTTKMSQIP
jgi:hypothetical protein